MSGALHLRPHGTSGKLIVFCGLDGCGKSTAIRQMQERLHDLGEPVLVTKQPTPEMRENHIFRTFMDQEDHSRYDYRALSLMAAADRLQHTKAEILPSLREGRTVLCDRYFYSCLANLRARGYGGDRWIYEIAEQIPRPDQAFFLDLPVETAVARVRSRPEERDRYIDMELQIRLREEYRNICRECGGILIRSDRGIADACEAMWQAVKSMYETNGGETHENE